MPYEVRYSDNGFDTLVVGSYDDFASAYKAARATFPEMAELIHNNRWHVMMYAYAKQLIEDTNDPLKVAYQDPTPNPEDEVVSVYISRY